MTDIDWKKCIFCQEITTESLQYPAKSKRRDMGAGYKTLCDNLLQFQNIGKNPAFISLLPLPKGDGIESTLRDNNAGWHKSCRVKWNKTSLNRAVKRKYQDECQVSSGESSVKHTRLSDPTEVNMKKSMCFFCDEDRSEESHVHISN